MKNAMFGFGNVGLVGLLASLMVFTVRLEADQPTFYAIYEPFNQSTGAIDGQAGGIGLNTWAIVNNGRIDAAGTRFIYGQLPYEGNIARVPPNSAGNTIYVTTTTALADAGLLDDGATLWFSFLYTKSAGGGAAERSGWAFGTDHLIKDGTGGQMSNSGNGLGMQSENRNIQPSTWVGGGAGNRADGTTFASFGDTVMVVGRIVWGATSDDVETLTLWTPDTEDLPANVAALGEGWSTTMPGVDQTEFDTISMHGDNSNAAHFYDEIRFGRTFDIVMGIEPPAAGTVIMIE